MGRVRLEAITWERLGDLLAERLLDLKPDDGSPWPRVAFDGAPAARPGDLASRVAEALRTRGRPSPGRGHATAFCAPPPSVWSTDGKTSRPITTAGSTPARCGARSSIPSKRAAPDGSCPISGIPSPTAPPAAPMSPCRRAASCCCTARSCSPLVPPRPERPRAALSGRPAPAHPQKPTTGPCPPSSATTRRPIRRRRPTSSCVRTTRAIRPGVADSRPTPALLNACACN